MSVMRLAIGRIWRLASHPALANAGWIIAERVGRLTISLVVGILVMRKLGVERLGAFSYSLTAASLFLPLSTCGLGENLVRRLVGDTEKGMVLGTAFWMRTVGTVAAYGLGMVAFLAMPNHTDATATDVALAGLVLWPAPLLVIDPFFQSLSRSRVVTMCGLAGGLLAAGFKLAGVIFDAPTAYFLLSNALDTILLAAGLWVAYRLLGDHEPWRFDSGMARSLLSEAAPSILAGFAVFIYDQSDVILLGILAQSTEIADRQIGLYSAAVRLSSAWRFVPFSILASAAPFLYRMQHRGHEQYHQGLVQVLSLVVACSYVFILPISIWSEPVLRFMLGHNYVDAAPVLSVHVWSNLFCLLGVGQSTWLIGRGLLWAGLRNTVIGAVANVILNVFVIPRYGAIGAAATTLIATCLATIPANAVFPATRELAAVLFRSMLLMGLPGIARYVRGAV